MRRSSGSRRIVTVPDDSTIDRARPSPVFRPMRRPRLNAAEPIVRDDVLGTKISVGSALNRNRSLKGVCLKWVVVGTSSTQTGRHPFDAMALIAIV
jgi:hypothetical protein